MEKGINKISLKALEVQDSQFIDFRLLVLEHNFQK